MRRRFFASAGALATVMAAVSLLPHPGEASGQTAQVQTGEPKAAWTPPHTSWDDPDFQGIWDYATMTPLQRPSEFAGKEFLTDDEVVALEQRKAERADGRPIWASGTYPTVHAPSWLDYGTKVVGTRRSSLIVDPPDGRIPALTPEARHRAEARRVSRREHPADSWEDRSLFERCLTLGVPRLPSSYNNNYLILQTPDHVVIVSEMIHNARIVPIGQAPASRPPRTSVAGQPAWPRLSRLSARVRCVYARPFVLLEPGLQIQLLQQPV